MLVACGSWKISFISPARDEFNRAGVPILELDFNPSMFSSSVVQLIESILAMLVSQLRVQPRFSEIAYHSLVLIIQFPRYHKAFPIEAHSLTQFQNLRSMT